MCGIAGIVSANKHEVQLEKLQALTNVIEYRGPDGDGHWIDQAQTVGLGHRRLSIIDLSNAGSQPMHYLDKYTIVFNGEIYNYVELREQCLQKGYTFKSHTDTEVLMALYDWHGIDCLQYLDGMFAFALYNSETKKLFIARDRFGEKPLFYSYQPNKYFYFGSELKQLWAAGIAKETNEVMLYNYLNYGYVQNSEDLSETFYKNCLRLPHANYCIINTQKVIIEKQAQYYNIDYTNINYSITETQAKNKLRELFYMSTAHRLRSDVQVGSSLSGGLDSSLVVGTINEIAKEQNHTSVNATFSAEFPGFKKNERPFMDMVIAHTNSEPYFVTPDDEGLLANFEKLCYHQEEPFGSASIYVQYCVMQLAKQKGVTVLLDGQGADEVFAGYHYYYPYFFKDLYKKNRVNYKEQVTAYLQTHKDNAINGAQHSALKNLAQVYLPSMLDTLRKTKLKRSGLFKESINKEFMHTYKNSMYNNEVKITSLNHALYYSAFKGGALQELLRYADRNSMAHSREVRLPFLNHQLVEFIFTLPEWFKINKGWTKWIMRETFDKELPIDIAWRVDKIGYEPPQQKWLEATALKNKISQAQTKLITQQKLKNSAQPSSAAMQWRLLMTDFA
jgi:asparagine synthase (glutamine-hydrolysing)